MFSLSSKTRLTTRDLPRFPDDTLFHRLARAVCAAGCLPRKELFEAWEVARRVRRRFRGGRVIDLCAGHGLLGQIMLLLDDTSAEIVVADKALPPSAETLHRALVDAWPRLDGRVTFLSADVGDVPLRAGDVVASIHACGALTDVVLRRAMAAGARVAVVPCCHHLGQRDSSDLAGWLDGPTAIDVMRAARLKAQGHRVWTLTIPDAITPHNRLLLAE